MSAHSPFLFRLRSEDSLRSDRVRGLDKTLLTVSKDNPNTKLFFKSYGAILKERKRHVESNKNVRIHPFSKFRMWYEVYLTFVYLAHFIAVPVRLAFSIRLKTLQVTEFDILVLLLDFLFLVDIIVTFNTGYAVELTQQVIFDKRGVAKQYLLGFFVVDFISSFPFDFIFLKCFPTQLHFFIYAQFLSLIKTFRFNTFLKYFTNLVEICSKDAIPIRYRRRIVEFFFLMNTGICLFNVVGTIVLNDGEIDGSLWFVRLNITHSYSQRYQFGLLFTLASMTTAGFGSIPPTHIGEMVISLIVMLCLGMYKNYICSFLNEEIRGTKSVSNEYLEMLSQIEEYMRYKQLPVQTQERFLEYFDYRFQKKYFREEFLMSALSEHLRSEVILHTCQSLLRSLTFQNLPPKLLGSILSTLRYEVYLPNDIIVRAGCVGDCMYFICSGTVALYTPTGKEIFIDKSNFNILASLAEDIVGWMVIMVAYDRGYNIVIYKQMFHLDDGDHFGEISLIMKDSKRAATVVALEMTELFRLDKQDFRELVAVNDALLKRVEAVATARMNKTILSEKVHIKSRGFSDD